MSVRNRWIFLILLAISLSACMTREIETHFIPIAQLNPNERRKPTPVNVKIIQLNSREKVDGSDFFSLFEKPQDALGKTFVSQEDLTVYPGKEKVVEVKVSEETRFISVVAAFRHCKKIAWKHVISLNDDSSSELRFKLQEEGLVRLKP